MPAVTLDRTLTKEAIEAARKKRCAVLMLGRGRFTLIDKRDLPKSSKHLWRIANHGYVVTNVAVRKIIYLHRFILDVRGEVDHRNGDKLDNRRMMLRPATRNQQGANARKHRRLDASSKFKGVTKEGQRWCAQIKINYKRHRIGHFDSEVKAASAYNRAARKRWGVFARLNKI